jgi:riboflavin kinase/FMN adenylyltransferase
MRLYREPAGIPADAKGAYAAIGNFDGVHRGHQAVIGEAIRLARAAGRKAAVVTFEPHPRRLFKPDLPPFLLTSVRMKIATLRDLGVDLCFALRFDRHLAGLTAEEFVARVLVGALDLEGIVAGYDFVFGKGRGGSPETLVGEMRKAGRVAKIVAPALDAAAAGSAGGETDPAAFVYSSTGVRDALKAGDPRAAARILGRSRSKGACATATRAAARSASRPRTSPLAPVCRRHSASMRCAWKVPFPAARWAVSPISACARRWAGIPHRASRSICSISRAISTGGA